ncbi:Tetraspanin/Peripherin [Dimargaris cristalligena]|uniref:Tetraspanin/Peripherin n=1 Tax=Dimargaris cristalligena TaxID=215637 RepID=A0A4P9ZUN3_9FUNG|nr:Tetraspanin/Peripherin [Dimargaris cristalligena]|eukprot:RKP36512.1 Tetraspanin/Peripherin [Dimargaris cristalligena]
MSEFSLPPNVRLSFLVTNCILLLAGGMGIGFMVYYLLHPFSRRNVVITEDMIFGGISCGGLSILVALVGYVGSMNPTRRKNFLLSYCWLAAVIQVAEMVLGAVVWFRTLDIKGDYYPKWQSWSDGLRANFQEYSHCCGYLTPTDFPAPSPTCQSIFDALSSTEGANSADVVLGQLTGCAVPLELYITNYLQNIYTVVFGFVVISFIAMLSGLVIYLSSRDLCRYIKTSEKLVHLRLDP